LAISAWKSLKIRAGHWACLLNAICTSSRSCCLLFVKESPYWI